MSPTLKPPAHSNELKIDFPADHVLLLTFNRPKSLNAMTPTMTGDLRRVLDWFEKEPELWVVIVTGAGRLFCAGADLKAWNNDQQRNKSDEQEDIIANEHGFASISRRQSVKPIIAAVCGGAYGGGTEIILNCDIVIADTGAKFALPEVKRGVVAIQGGIPRLAQIAGHQHACNEGADFVLFRISKLASELLLLGRVIDVTEAQTRFGFVNRVVALSDVLPTALSVAQEIVANSPDAVQSSKQGLLLSQKLSVHESQLAHVKGRASTRVYKGDNIKEGLKAFNEKRAPRWRNPAKL